MSKSGTDKTYCWTIYTIPVEVDVTDIIEGSYSITGNKLTIVVDNLEHPGLSFTEADIPLEKRTLIYSLPEGEE